MHAGTVRPLEGAAWIFIMYTVHRDEVLPLQAREEFHVAFPY